MGDSWYNKDSKEGFDKKHKQDTAAKLRKERTAHSFWLKDGKEAKLIFVDSNPFFCFRHSIKIDGRWDTVTCTKDFAPCPMCADGEKSTYTAYLTVIDTREYEKKDGEKVKNKRVLYPAKGSTIIKIEKLLKKHGDLNGHVFVVARYTANDPNCGTDFDHKGKVNIAKKLGDKENQPFEYEKVLAPPSKEEYAAIGYGDFSVSGSDDDIDDADDMDDLLD